MGQSALSSELSATQHFTRMTSPMQYRVLSAESIVGFLGQ